MSPGDTQVLVQNGELLSGILCKKTVGATSGGLIHIIVNECGNEAARDFFGTCSAWSTTGCSTMALLVGIGDTVADQPDHGHHQLPPLPMQRKPSRRLSYGRRRRLSCNPGMTLRESFEVEVNKLPQQGT